MKYQTSRRVNVCLPTELLEKLDVIAKRNYISRSELIRYCLMTQFSRQFSRTESNELDDHHNPPKPHSTK